MIKPIPYIKINGLIGNQHGTVQMAERLNREIKALNQFIKKYNSETYPFFSKPSANKKNTLLQIYALHKKIIALPSSVHLSQFRSIGFDFENEFHFGLLNTLKRKFSKMGKHLLEGTDEVLRNQCLSFIGNQPPGNPQQELAKILDSLSHEEILQFIGIFEDSEQMDAKLARFQPLRQFLNQGFQFTPLHHGHTAIFQIHGPAGTSFILKLATMPPLISDLQKFELSEDLAPVILPVTMDRVIRHRHSQILSLTEYCPNGALKPPLSAEEFKRGTPNAVFHRGINYFQQMAHILVYFNKKQLVFPDMKNANWLINASHELKISDYKSILRTKADAFKHDDSLLFSPQAKPPELEGHHSLQADKIHAYILGVNLYHYFTACHEEYLADTRPEHFDFDAYPLFSEATGQQLKTLIQQLTAADPEERLSVAQALTILNQLDELQQAQQTNLNLLEEIELLKIGEKDEEMLRFCEHYQGQIIHAPVAEQQRIAHDLNQIKRSLLNTRIKIKYSNDKLLQLEEKPNIDETQFIHIPIPQREAAANCQLQRLNFVQKMMRLLPQGQMYQQINDLIALLRSVDTNNGTVTEHYPEDLPHRLGISLFVQVPPDNEKYLEFVALLEDKMPTLWQASLEHYQEEFPRTALQQVMLKGFTTEVLSDEELDCAAQYFGTHLQEQPPNHHMKQFVMKRQLGVIPKLCQFIQQLEINPNLINHLKNLFNADEEELERLRKLSQDSPTMTRKSKHYSQQKPEAQFFIEQQLGGLYVHFNIVFLNALKFGRTKETQALANEACFPEVIRLLPTVQEAIVQTMIDAVNDVPLHARWQAVMGEQSPQLCAPAFAKKLSKLIHTSPTPVDQIQILIAWMSQKIPRRNQYMMKVLRDFLEAKENIVGPTDEGICFALLQAMDAHAGQMIFKELASRKSHRKLEVQHLLLKYHFPKAYAQLHQEEQFMETLLQEGEQRALFNLFETKPHDFDKLPLTKLSDLKALILDKEDIDLAELRKILGILYSQASNDVFLTEVIPMIIDAINELEAALPHQLNQLVPLIAQTLVVSWLPAAEEKEEKVQETPKINPSFIGLLLQQKLPITLRSALEQYPLENLTLPYRAFLKLFKRSSLDPGEANYLLVTQCRHLLSFLSGFDEAALRRMTASLFPVEKPEISAMDAEFLLELQGYTGRILDKEDPMPQNDYFRYLQESITTYKSNTAVNPRLSECHNQYRALVELFIDAARAKAFPICQALSADPRFIVAVQTMPSLQERIFDLVCSDFDVTIGISQMNFAYLSQLWGRKLLEAVSTLPLNRPVITKLITLVSATKEAGRHLEEAVERSFLLAVKDEVLIAQLLEAQPKPAPSQVNHRNALFTPPEEKHNQTAYGLGFGVLT